MREYIGSRTRAFLPVRLAEWHSAVRTKAIARALRQAAGYKPAGRHRPTACVPPDVSYGWSRIT